MQEKIRDYGHPIERPDVDDLIYGNDSYRSTK